MNIWICNPFDRLPGETGSEGRYIRLTSALSGLGHSVLWWTSAFSHSSKTIRNQSEFFEPEGLKIHLISTRPYASNISLARISNHMEFSRKVAHAMHTALESGERPDRIIVSLPLISATARIVHLANEFSIPVVVDIQDVWPDSFRVLLPAGCFFDVVSFLLFWPTRQKVRNALQQADHVIATCVTYQEWAASLGSNATQYFYLGTNRRRRTTEIPETPQLKSSKPTTRLIYSGSMGAVYDLETIILAADKLIEEGYTLRVDFAGSGEQESKLKKMAEQLGLSDWIYFHGFLDSQAFGDLLCASDIGVIAMYPDSQVAMPNKAADYLSAGLAVLNSLPDELERKLSEYGCGRSYQAGDSESLVAGLRPWLESADALAKAKAGASRLFEAHFDAAKIYPAYAEWVVGA